MADVTLRPWAAAEYHADARLSRSRLAVFEDSPRLYDGFYNTRSLPEPAPTATMEFGTLAHMAVLEPHDWQRYLADVEHRLVVKPKFAGKGARSAEAAWRAALPANAMVVTPTQRRSLREDHARVEAVAQAVLAHPGARRILDTSEREVTYTWRDTDPELRAPLECRARLDLLHVSHARAVITDLKTAADPSPAAFARALANHRYHWQAPFYSAPVLEATGLVPLFGFIVVRSELPHEVAVYQLRPEDIAAADAQVRRALRRLSVCIETNNWAAPWESRAQVLDVPRWALQETV